MLSNAFFESLNMGIQKAEAPDCWQRLTDYCSKMSQDQQLFVNQKPEVVEVRNKLMEAFSLFLFEKFKTEFSKVADFQQLCNSYIDTVIQAGQDYSKQVVNVMDENKALIARIAELEGRHDRQ